jgi:hypothetical protein
MQQRGKDVDGRNKSGHDAIRESTGRDAVLRMALDAIHLLLYGAAVGVDVDGDGF